MKFPKIKLPLFPLTGVLIAVSLLLSAFSAAALVQVPAQNETTGEVKQEAGSGEIILEEKFADNSNKWDFSTNENSESVIEDGKLKVRVTSNGKFTYIKPPVDADEVDLSVDAEFTEGDSMQYGFICHYKDKDNYIQAVASTKGSYSIIKKVKSEFSDLVTWNPSNLIDKGPDVVNHLRLVCGEGHITFFINDTIAADVIDSSLSGGSYRLAAGWPKSDSEKSGPVGVSFSNLVVRKPLAWTPSTEVLLSDSFDNNDNAWSLMEKDEYTIQIQDGQNVMRIMKPDFYLYNRSPVQLSDVDMSFDVTFQEGTPSNAGFGAMCRWSNKDNFYEFRMKGDGNFRVGKSVKGTWETLTDWTASSAIKSGIGKTNRLRVVCAGSNLELYANDQLLTKTEDASLTAGGSNIIANSFEVDSTPVAVAFDNLEVKYPVKTPGEKQASKTSLFEDFKNNDNGWSLMKDSDGAIEIVDGVMLMKIEKENLRFWSVPEISSSNVDMTIGTFIVEGKPSNIGFGAVCRYTDENNYYDFNISGDGYYLLGKSVNGKWEALVDWTASDAIQKGVLVPNAIRVVCSGNKLEFYANDKLLVKKTDDSLTTGSIGLFTDRRSEDNVPVSVAFDTVDVKEP